jgi:hypothetical protein
MKSRHSYSSLWALFAQFLEYLGKGLGVIIEHVGIDLGGVAGVCPCIDSHFFTLLATVIQWIFL